MKAFEKDRKQNRHPHPVFLFDSSKAANPYCVSVGFAMYGIVWQQPRGNQLLTAWRGVAARETLRQAYLV